MIAIIDYQMGNIRSLMNALEFLGCEHCLTRNAEEIVIADKIMLPGVGAFDLAMDNLKKFDLLDVLNCAVLEKKIPILGICLGMQLLASSGQENTQTKGLDWIDGAVESISLLDPDVRVPHIGFNSVTIFDKEPNLFAGLEDGTDFYFIHSYHMICKDSSDITSQVEYGEVDVVSSVQKDNVFGTQFHPEKSQNNGLTFLKNFISI